MLLRFLTALLGGFLLAGAFEPYGHAVLMPPALAILVLSVRGLRPVRAGLVSLLFGAAFCYTTLFWMKGSVGPDAWLAMNALETAFFFPLGIGLALSLRSRAWPLWAAAWWTAVEAVRAVWPFSGMPFGRLAFASADTVWQEALPWVGMTGVTFLIALSGATLAWAVLTVRQRPTQVVVGVVALAAVTALPHLVQWRFEATGSARVAAVQGNVPGDGTDVVGNHRAITANHVRLSEDLGASIAAGEEEPVDFVVWPENSTAVDPFTDTEVNAGITAASEALGVPLLVGSMVDSPRDGEVLNQGIVWNPGVGGGDRYTKMHPVPYGEYIPFRDTVIPSDFGKLRQITRDMARGTRVDPLVIDDLRIADAICFDVAYDDGLSAQLRQGADLVTVQTSNAMFIKTAQIEQQFEITRLRAVESRRWVVVAALNGVSGIVGPDGTVHERSRARTEAVLSHEVQLSDTVTPASWAGEWTARAFVLLVALHALVGVVTYGGRRRASAMLEGQRPQGSTHA